MTIFSDPAIMRRSATRERSSMGMYRSNDGSRNVRTPVRAHGPIVLPRKDRSFRVMNRAYDLVVAAVALLLLAPLFIVVGFLIRTTSPGPAFFRQDRHGLMVSCSASTSSAQCGRIFATAVELLRP